MKKLFYVFAAMAFLTTFIACEKNEFNSEDESLCNNALYAETEYNLDMRNFARAINQVVSKNESFRELIKKEAHQKFKGDHDVLLINIMNKFVDVDNDIASEKKTAKTIKVSEILNNACATDVKDKYLTFSQTRQSHTELTPGEGISMIEKLAKKYPLLQVSVPLHLEDLEDKSYIPPVVFIPDNADEETTKYLPGFLNNKEIIINAVDEPQRAVIVIGMNERTKPAFLTENIKPNTPSGLTAQPSEHGVYLNWTMPSGTTSINTLGYKVYRKEGIEPNYTLIGSFNGHSNREYTDEDVTNNVTYRYYVEAFNDYQTSDNSNYVTIMLPRPAAPSFFSVGQEALNIAKLSWAFAPNEYNGTVSLYKREMGKSTSYGDPFKTLTMPVDEYFDTQINPGQKIEYKMERKTAIGTSIPKYDFIYAPYRDMSKNSEVFIRKLKFSDIRAIEPWWKGAPEFKIKVLGINGNSTIELADLFIPLNSRKNNRWTTVDNDKGNAYSYWKPESARWFDCISFYFVEDDGGANAFNPWEELTLMGQKFGKKITSDSTSQYINASLEVLDIAGKLYKEWTLRGDEKIGYVYLRYYDNPKGEFKTNSAEKGGTLTVQFSDTPL